MLTCFCYYFAIKSKIQELIIMNRVDSTQHIQLNNSGYSSIKITNTSRSLVGRQLEKIGCVAQKAIDSIKRGVHASYRFIVDNRKVILITAGVVISSVGLAVAGIFYAKKMNEKIQPKQQPAQASKSAASPVEISPITIKIDNSDFHVDKTEWSIRDIGTLSLFDEAYLRECNDNGQALIYGRLKRDPYKWAFWDPQRGLISIPTPPSDGFEYKWLRVNGDGLVVGLQRRPVPRSTNAFHCDLITWSIAQGFKEYKTQVENKIHIEETGFLARSRSSNLVVVNRKADNSEDNQILVLQNNKLMDLTPSLKKQAQSLGFDAGGWQVSHVNSQGMLLGIFYHYEKHPYKKTKLKKSAHCFMQDGDKFYLVELPTGFPCHEGTLSGSGVFFDASGRVFVNRNQSHECKHDSMIWTRENGLTKLKPPPYIEELAKQDGALPIKATQLQEDGTIIWKMSYNSWEPNQSKRGYIFEKEGKYWFLPLNIKGEPVFNNLEKYPGLELKGENHYPFSVFQQRKSFIQVDFLGESHPFMVEITQ